MKVTVEDAGACVKNLQIVVDKEEVEKEHEGLFKEYRSDISIPGFRKGKFPRKLFERKYADTIKDDVRGRIREKFIKEALEEHKLEPVIPAVMDDKSFKRGEDYVFTARVELKPVITVPDLKEITLSREEHAVTDEMIEREVSFLRERRLEYKPKDGDTVAEGDKVLVSYVITADGQTIDTQEEGSLFAEEHGSFLGAVADYPAVIIGKKKGQSVSFKTVLPPYFGKKEYQGKPAEVNLTIKGVEAKVLPDASSKEFLEFYGLASVEDMQAKIREGIANGQKQEATAKLQEQIRDYIAAAVDAELPPTLLEGEIQSRRRNMVNGMQSQKKSQEEIDKAVTEQVAELAQSARRALQVFFFLEKVAEGNTVIVTEEELEERIARVAIQQRVTPADMKAHLLRTGGIENLREQLREDKTYQYIIDHATIGMGPVEKPKPKAAEEKPAKAEKAEKTEKPAKAENAEKAPKDEKPAPRKKAAKKASDEKE
ncbi:MAG: trigger factor [Planctomycetota bacterium]